MLLIELEGQANKMQGIETLKELGIKVNVDYLNIRRD